MWIVLDTLPGDNPYRDMRQIDVNVIRASRSVEHYRGLFYGGEIALEPVPRDEATLVLIEGLDLDAQVVARGELTPEQPERQGRCCLHMCFCSLSVFDAGECLCGSGRCAETCSVMPEE